MKEYEQRNFRGKILNIENTPRCTLECPACKRTTFFDLHNTKKVPGRDMTPDEFRKCIKYFRKINFCGQLSDPIYGTHFLELLKIAYEENVWVEVATAASSRSRDWYKKAFEANPKAKWIFGIDGLPHLSHLHRINQDGEKLFQMMVMAKEMGLNVLWQLIVFSFNEDTIDECAELARKHRIDIDLIISSRGIDTWLLPTKPEFQVERL